MNSKCLHILAGLLGGLGLIACAGPSEDSDGAASHTSAAGYTGAPAAS